MNETLNVYMDGTLCGYLLQTTSGDLRFRYDESYSNTPGATPVSLSMPLAQPEHRKRVVLPFFEGLLTDSAPARQAMAMQWGLSPAATFALLAHVGRDVAGALQLLLPGEASSDSLPRGAVEEVSTADIEIMLNEVTEEYQTGRPILQDKKRFSLAGAQPKIALTSLGEGRWGLPIGSTPTTHIIKPATGTFRRLDVVEHLTMRAAAHLGLDVAPTSVQWFGQRVAIVGTRYDRAISDGRWVRLHQEDLAQALSVPPAKKYQHQDGGPGVGQIAQLFRGLPHVADRLTAAEAFFAALMFNTWLHCTDAHAKNYSVLLTGDRVRLAPLYDLATYAPYEIPGDREVSSAMKIGDQYRYALIGMPECLAAAKTLGVGPDRAEEVVSRIRTQAVAAFEAAGDEMQSADAATRAMVSDVIAAVARLPRLAYP